MKNEMSGFGRHDSLMGKLGEYRIGKSCLYIKRLAEVDSRVLGMLIDRSVRPMKNSHA